MKKIILISLIILLPIANANADIPLPSVVPDAQPGGDILNSMQAAEAYSQQRLQNQNLALQNQMLQEQITIMQQQRAAMEMQTMEQQEKEQQRYYKNHKRKN